MKKTNNYLEMKERHQQEVNEFPLMFAFSNKQFDEGMRKLGLKPTDTDKIYKLGSAGGYYKKSDSKALHEMFAMHEQEKQKAIENDTTGEGYIYDMFNYELANHEYCITYDITDTIEALDLTMEEINNNKALLNGLNKAKDNQLESIY